MIKCEVIENFTLEKFNQLKNVNKVISRKDNEFGVKDTFECDKEMADYLLGNNVLNKTVVKVIEVQEIPVIGHRTDDVEGIFPLEENALEKAIERLRAINATLFL